MKYSMSNNNKKKRRLTLLSIAAFVVILSIGGWLGYNGWDIQRSMQSLGFANAEEPESLDEEGLIPVGGDPTETEEIPPKEEPSKEVPVEEEEPSTEKPKEETPKGEETPSKQPTKSPADNKEDNGGYVEGIELPSEPTYINGILIANKRNPLPANFAPGENVEARAAFEEMAAEARLSGFELVAFSTYRSFDYQTTLYNRYVARDGQAAADRYSARPGFSEHQTGLAFDIGERNFEQHWASSAFGETAAGQWVAENAHRYGFILRYPEGKEEITGYMHESWHFRYVGEGIATDIYINDLTLEEYLNR